MLLELVMWWPGKELHRKHDNPYVLMDSSSTNDELCDTLSWVMYL